MTECPPRSYGSFCPVAQASEVVAQRWVPLILREIMVGYHRFNEIRHALPLISPSVLSQRLRSLEDDGVIYRRIESGGVTYHLTPAGEELRPIVDSLGHWARKWVNRDYRSYELDPGVMMWSLRRHVMTEEFPSGRTVVHFELEGAPRLRRYWWLVVQREARDVDVCMTDPGHPVTLTVTAKLRSLIDVLMGDARLKDVLREGLLSIEGERELVRRFERLFEFEGGAHSFVGGGHQKAVEPAKPRRVGAL
ncbi:MAG TPA: winged helix-turn-helix transcriptional regulator [Gemmatimonadales bacterium]|nr:winged helix-turn-helix transcriptional regulator [Gemmatimonadales bacterium]